LKCAGPDSSGLAARPLSHAWYPARKVAKEHKCELRRRLKCIAEKLKSTAPNELAGQLALQINGAFVSAPIFEPGEAASLRRKAAEALIRKRPV